MWRKVWTTLPRISALRTLVALFQGCRALVGRHFRIVGVRNIRCQRGVARMGTGRFPFVDRRSHSFLRVDGLLELGGPVAVAPGATWEIRHGAVMRVGEGTFFNSNSLVSASLSITIGRECAISWGVQILDDDEHDVHDMTNTTESRPRCAPVTIGNRVLIGNHVTILRGTEIPCCCVVAAGAVVRGKFEGENLLIGGVPARVLRRNITWTP